MATSEEAQVPGPVAGASMFQALRSPPFRLIWASSWCFYAARMLELAVLLWLVLELTSSPSKVALVGVFRTTPMFLLGLFAGTLADRLPRKHLLLAAQSLNAGTALTMALLLATGDIQFWYAYVAVFMTGSAWAVDFSARRALVSEIFSGPRLVNAISLDSAVLTGGNMIGPLLGGAMIYLSGFAGAYSLLATLYFAGVVFILFVRVPADSKTSAPQTTPPSQWEALRSIRNNPVVWGVLLITVSFNLFAFPFQQMLPLIARDVLGTGPVLYGMMGSAVGVGAISGSLLIARGRFSRYGTLFSLGASLVTASLFAFSFSTLYPLSVLLLMVAGLGMSGFAVLQPVLVLQAVPSHIRGRAMGAIALCIGFNPLGIILVGQLAEAWGPQIALAAIAGIGLVVISVLRWRYPSLRDKAPAAQVLGTAPSDRMSTL